MVGPLISNLLHHVPKRRGITEGRNTFRWCLGGGNGIGHGVVGKARWGEGGSGNYGLFSLLALHPTGVSS